MFLRKYGEKGWFVCVRRNVGEERCLTYSHQYLGYTSGCYVGPATLYSYVQHIYVELCV